MIFKVHSNPLTFYDSKIGFNTDNLSIFAVEKDLKTSAVYFVFFWIYAVLARKTTKICYPFQIQYSFTLLLFAPEEDKRSSFAVDKNTSTKNTLIICCVVHKNKKYLYSSDF